LKSDYNGEIVGKHNVNSYAVKVNGTGKTTVRNRASLRKIPPPVPDHQPLIVQDPGKSSGPSAELATGRQGAAGSQGAVGSQGAGGSQGAVPSGMVTRAGLASSTESRQSNVGSEQNAGSRSLAEACDSIMQVAANMAKPGILSV
jgi:hypothetical protein